MKKLILAALIPATVGLAAPAFAQPVPPPPGGWHNGSGYGGPGYGRPGYGRPGYGGGWMNPQRNAAIRSDIDGLSFAIDRAQQNRTISYREANGLRRDVYGIQRAYRIAARNGLSRQDVHDLARRVNLVRMKLRMERADWDRDRW